MSRAALKGSVLALLCLGLEMAFAATPGNSEITLNEGTHIALRLNDYLSTKLSNEGETFTAEVISPIYQGDRLVIPKGSSVSGSISRIVRPGRFRGKALMTVIFHSIRIPGRAEIPLVASLANVEPEGAIGLKSEGAAIEGEGSKGRDAARVAKPGLVGAGIGTLVNGSKGAAIGGGIGAVVGLATVFSTRGKDLEVRRGSTLDIVLDRPLVVAVEGEGVVARSPR